MDMKFLSTICIVWMVFASCVSTFGQGVAIRSLNGLGTNLNLKGSFVVNTNGLVVINNGNVGIGTTAPATNAEVVGAIRSTRTGTPMQWVQLQGGDSAATRITGSSAPGSEKPLLIQQFSAEVIPTLLNRIEFQLGTNTAPSTIMTIAYNGNVGVGVTAPANKLDVEGAVAIGSAFSGSSTAPANGLIVSGNTGIGTSDPYDKLTVSDAPDINVHIGSLGGLATIYSLNDIESTYTTMQISAMPLLLNNTSGGKVGIGTNAPAAKVHVTADNSTDLILQVGTTNRPSQLTLNTNGLLALEYGTLYKSNSLALPTAAQIGVGGVWAGNSNGFLVTLKSINGTTTSMIIIH